METWIAQLPLLLGSPEASAASGSGGGGGQLLSLLVTFGLIIVIFYFLIIRPQSKKQKDTQKMLSTLKKGDKVVTAGGIRGIIHSVKEDSVLLRVDDNTKLEFSRSAVTGVISREESEDATAPAVRDKSGRKGKGAKGGESGAGNGTQPAEDAAATAQDDGDGADADKAK